MVNDSANAMRLVVVVNHGRQGVVPTTTERLGAKGTETVLLLDQVLNLLTSETMCRNGSGVEVVL